MQELRSTEILDKEIQSDARKKAERILQGAKESALQIEASLDSDVEKAKADKEDFYKRKLNSYVQDLNASLPLEKERFRVDFINKAILQNINLYLKKLSEKEKMELCFKSFDCNLQKKVKVYVYGFDLKSAKNFISGKLKDFAGEIEETKYGKIVPEDEYALEEAKGFILEAEDKSFRVRLTLAQIVKNLLEEKNQELAAVLFGGI